MSQQQQQQSSSLSNNTNNNPHPLTYCIPVINRILAFHEYPRASRAFELRRVSKAWQDAIENYAPQFWHNIFGIGLGKNLLQQQVGDQQQEQRVNNNNNNSNVSYFFHTLLFNESSQSRLDRAKLERLIKPFFFKCLFPMLRASSEITHHHHNNNLDNRNNRDDDDENEISSSSSPLWLVGAVARSGWCAENDFQFSNIDDEEQAFDRLVEEAQRSSREAHSYFGERNAKESAFYFRDWHFWDKSGRTKISRDPSHKISFLRRLVADASRLETRDSLEAVEIILHQQQNNNKSSCFDSNLHSWCVPEGRESVSLLNLACVLGGTKVAKILFHHFYYDSESNKNNNNDSAYLSSANAFFGHDTLSQPTGISPLAMCCIYNRPEILKFLIQNIREQITMHHHNHQENETGDHKNALSRIIDTSDRAGMTPLLYAAIFNNVECFKILVEEGFADINQKSVYPIPPSEEEKIKSRVPRKISSSQFVLSASPSSLASSGPNNQRMEPSSWNDAFKQETIYFCGSTSTTRNCGLWPRAFDENRPLSPALALRGSTPLIIACYMNALDVVKYLFATAKTENSAKSSSAAEKGGEVVNLWHSNSRSQNAFLVSLHHWKNGKELVQLWIDSGFLKNCSDEIRERIVNAAFDDDRYLRFSETAELLMKSGVCRSSHPETHWTRFI